MIPIGLVGAVALQALTSGAQVITIPGGVPIVTNVGGGFAYSLFLKSDGSLWGAGAFANNYPTNLPVQMVGSNVTAIAAGAYHALFLKSDGSLWGMGLNQYGELGNGTYDIFFTNVPQKIVASNVTAIAAGAYHSLFLKSDGSLWGMGCNETGQLGDGTSGPMNKTNLPELIVASNVTAIAAGAYHSLFLERDGSLWGMGANEPYGQLGDAPNGLPQDYYVTPVEIVSNNVTTIGAGYFFSLFLKSGGSLWGMGENDAGQLGNGTYNNVEVPEELLASGVTAFAGGDLHSLFLHGDGSLWTTGFNEFGQLGDGTYNPTNVPQLIEDGDVTVVAAGAYHSLFVKSDGSLWAMGRNEYGDLGDGIEIGDTNQPELIVAAPVVVTNTVTFIVDMSAQAGIGNFSIANGDVVELRGAFTGWSPGIIMANNPADANTNDFYTTLTFVGDAGTQVDFRYAIVAPDQPQPYYEVLPLPPVGYRTMTLVSPSGNYTNGPVYFSNESPTDLLTVTTMVTFTVDMTPAINSGAFVEAVDEVSLNGIADGYANNWWTWGTIAADQYGMTEIGTSTLYAITVPINSGQPLEQFYQYGIDGQDDEAPLGDNHSRYIRRMPNYTMPTDVFGGQGTTTSTEPSFGPNITINSTNSQVWLSWLGRPGVSLQCTTSLTPRIAWQPMPLTDGTNLLVGQGTGIATTNFTVGTSNLFWELIGPQ